LNVAALAVALAAGVACAGSYTNSASGNWSEGSSWTGTVPSAGGAADAEVVFSGAGSLASANNLGGTFALNRMDFVAGAVTLSGNALAFTNNGATGPQVVNASGSLATLNNPLVLGRDTTVCTTNSITFNGLVSGKGGLIKTGPYTLTLTNNVNTYVGTTLVTAGRLEIQGVGTAASSASTNFTVLGGATLRLYDSKANPFWYAPANSVFTVQSNATFSIEVNAMQCGYLNAASGATVTGSPLLAGRDAADLKTATLGSLNLKRIILQPVGSATPTQTITFDGTGNGLSIGTDSGNAFSWRGGSTGLNSLQTVKLDVGDSPSAAIDLLVPFLNVRPNGTPGQAFIKQGAGLMQVNAMDWDSAPTPVKQLTCTVSGGTLVWNTSATNALGVNFASIAVSNNATLQVGAGGTTGAIYTNVANEGTLVFNRSDSQTFAKVISGAGGIVKSGANTLTLTGANSYSGGTAVNGGTLVVSAPGALGGGAVTVASGSTLAGDGTIGGPVNLASGGTLSGSVIVGGPVSVAAGALLSPAGTNALGTLTLASAGADALTLNGGTLLFDLSTVAGTCDQIPVAGTLVLNGANTIALSFSGTPPAGTYTLMTYAARAGEGTLALNTLYPNATLTVGSTSVTLTVTGAGISFLKWKGTVSGVWDTTTENWTRDGAASVYAEGDAVLFDDTAAGNFTVSSDAPVSPSSVSFNNSINNYVLSASIAGPGTPVFKLGTSVATLTGTNTYGGGTTLGAGTLSVSAYTNLPTAGGLTFNGGLLKILGTTLNSLEPYAVNWASFRGGLDLATNNTITVTNVIAGTGSLTKSGAGVLVPLATNTYSGGTTVNAGYVRVYNASALGSGPVNITGYNNELDLMGGLDMTNALTIRGVGVVNSVGSLQSFSGTSNTWSGPVTLGESAARLGGDNATLTVSGVISSGANVWGPVIRMPAAGGGTLLLTTNNTWLGYTWIRCGILRLGINNALPTHVSLQIGLGASQTGNVDATFDLAGFNQQVSGLFNASPIDNGRVVTNSAATPSTLTVNNASSPYTFDGVIAGHVALVKAGNGTQTLAGTNTTSGGVTVNAGTLVVGANGTLGVNCTNIVVAAGTLALSNSVSLADTAALRIANGGGAKVSLAAGVDEAVGTLWFGDKQRPGGTYGASGSGASVTDDVHFAGGGKLTVLHGNGGTRIWLN
jgi:autotransporter-associated beta strand protein